MTGLCHTHGVLPALPRGLAICMLLAMPACTSARDGSGGSVELSWRLRDQTGTLLTSCSQANVSAIRLSWDVGGITNSESWPCDDNHAITRFVIPEGLATLTISPDCASGPAAPATYTAPSPLVRNVQQGGVVELGAVVLLLQIDLRVEPHSTCDNL
jgi:hypothetical protein